MSSEGWGESLPVGLQTGCPRSRSRRAGRGAHASGGTPEGVGGTGTGEGIGWGRGWEGTGGGGSGKHTHPVTPVRPGRAVQVGGLEDESKWQDLES